MPGESASRCWTAGRLAALGIDPDPQQFFILHPPDSRAGRHRGPRAPPPRVGIGVIGEFRQEKDPERLLRILVAARERGGIGPRLVLGCPNEAILERWRSARVEGNDTADYQDYLAALASCEVVVLNYQAAGYYYRSSGVIGDAIALGAAVACPDFPVFRRQITEPVTVGAAFQGPADLARPSIRP